MCICTLQLVLRCVLLGKCICFSPRDLFIVSPLFKLIFQSCNRISVLNRPLQECLIQPVMFPVSSGVTKPYSCWKIASEEDSVLIQSTNFYWVVVCARCYLVCWDTAVDKIDTGLGLDGLKSNYITLHSCKISIPCLHTNPLLTAYLEIGMTIATCLCALVLMPFQLH